MRISGTGLTRGVNLFEHRANFLEIYQERSVGRTKEAIVLWKSATETGVWKTLTQLSCRVCFPSARIRFVGPQGNESGPTFSPALFYVGDRPGRFEDAIRQIGDIWVVPKGVIINTGRGPRHERRKSRATGALRLAREKANHERNRAKCKRYCRKRVVKGKGGERD